MKKYVGPGIVTAALVMSALAIDLVTIIPAHAQVAPGYTFTTLINFDTAGVVGFGPRSGVTFGNDGNLYGTTFNGGESGHNEGTLYRYIPTTSSYNTLMTFNTVDAPGSNPYAGLALSSDGSFYGTTSLGGSTGQATGSLYRYTPSSGQYSTLINFGVDLSGFAPHSGITFGSDGSLYGTTFQGGVASAGTLYRYIPSTGVITTLADFGTPGAIGINPHSGVTLGNDGTIYGTTPGSTDASNSGTLYSYNPSTGVFKTLIDFGTVGVSTIQTLSGVTMGADGNLYGTTTGGAANSGTLYCYNLSTGNVTTLVNFGTSEATGVGPLSDLTLGSDGSLYGTTDGGGSGVPGMDGTLYRYNPVTDVFTTLVNFGTSGISGWSPVAGITFGNDGSLYGTTLSGGDGSVSNGGGILYRLSSSSIAAPEPSSMMLLIFGGLSVVGKRVQRHRRRY